MSWSYSPASLSTTPKDQVRFLIGDTNTSDQQLQDEEIAYLLTVRTDTLLCAADAALSLQAKYARQADTTNSKLGVRASQRAAAYGALAETLKQRSLSITGALMFAGGLSIAGKEALAQDSDAVQPAFSVGQDDEPGANTSALNPAIWPWS